MMTTGSSDFLDLAERKLGWIEARTRILAGNVANADTPGYIPRDLKPFSLEAFSGGLALARTDAADLPAPAMPAQVDQVDAGDRSPDGNAVALDHQLKLVADNEQDQRVVTTLYKKYVSLTNIALGV